MIIIGITGTIGSGKGTVVQYLKDRYGFKHYSARTFISEEVARQGLPDVRDNMRIVGNELRAAHGSSYVAENLYDRAITDGGNSVLESLRSPGEIVALRSKPQSFFLLAVDADPKIRYERIILRHSSTDSISFEEFLADEAKEMTSTDPDAQNISECMKMADALVENDGDVENLYKQIDEIVASLLNN